MKQLIYPLLAALALTGHTAMAQAADDSRSAVHRKAYGYFLRNGNFANSSYGFSSFYLDDLDHAELVYPYGDEMGVYAGACADDVIYAYEYEYDAFMGPQNGNFVAYDIVTGRLSKLGTAGLEGLGSGFKPQDMTYDYATSTMYALGFMYGESALYKVNLADGTLTKAVTLGKTLGTIAADGDGAVYGAGANDGAIYKVNMADGSLEKIAETSYGGMMSNQTMEFDHSSGMLYWAANSYDYDGARETYMLRIDLDANPVAVENLGRIGSSSSLLAMYIPFAEGGDDAPASPADFTVTPGLQGSLTARLSWTAPTTTFGGSPLSDNAITGYAVERGGELIATLPADATSYDDNAVPADAEYVYTIYAINGAGNGGKSRAYAFIGHDRPCAVTDLVFNVGDGCASATLAWNAPTQGFSGGYFTQDGLTYTIVRHPDNRTVAEGLTETTFTDSQPGRLGRYHYTVYACNAYGRTPASTLDAYVLGAAMDVPVSQDFSNLTYFENQWMAYDGNADNYSWTYSSEWGYYQFGDATPCAEYIVNIGIDNYGNDADEWLVTPPISFSKDKAYSIKLNVRCTSDEEMALTVGGNNIFNTHEQFGTITFKPVLTEDGGNWVFADYEADLPAGLDGVKCIGLHLISPYPASGMSYLQIAGVTVSEGGATGISSAAGLQATPQPRAVYTIDGRLVRTDGTLDGLDKGIYIIGGKKQVKR